MPERLLVLELESPEPSKVFDTLALQVDRVESLHRVKSLEGLDEAKTRHRPTGIVLNWTASRVPELAVEVLLQSPGLCEIPLVVSAREMPAEGLGLLREYAVGAVVPQTLNPQSDCLRLLERFKVLRSGSTPEGAAALFLRSFFSSIHAEDYLVAEQMLQMQEAQRLGREIQVFLAGMILKKQKKFDDALKFLSEGLAITRHGKNLEPRFLHLIGNVAFKRRDYASARNFLEAAQRVSPLNLRRRFILAQLHFETQAWEEALKAYKAVLAACPAYPGPHARIIEIEFPAAKTLAEVDRLAPLLAHIPALRLASLARSLKSDVPALKARLSLLIIKELYRHADAAVARDDFYAALNLYSHVRRMVPEDETEARIEFLLRCGEVLVMSVDLSAAKKTLATLASLNASGERFEALRTAYLIAASRQEKATG